MQLATISTNNARVGTCPHGLPLGACPICNGMGGGGGMKKADFSAKPGEMSWNECAAIGAFLKAQANAKAQRQQDIQNFAIQMQNFQTAMTNARAKIAEIAQFFSNNTPAIISKPINFVLNTIIGGAINLIKNIPTAITNTIQTTQQKLADISDKLTAMMGELKASIEKKISEMGEMGYTDYVIEQGIKLEGVNGASNVDVTLTGMFGEYTITAVAVNSSQKISSQTVFTGLEWEDVVSGNYIFASQTADGKGVAAKNITGVDSNPVILQVCTTDETLYRFKDVYGTDKNLKINLIDYYGTNNNGDYQFFRVPNTKTPYTYGNFGEVSVCDIGYWQGDESFVTQSGYESGMYTDKTCFIFVAYQVSAGALGYGFDYFIPNE